MRGHGKMESRPLFLRPKALQSQSGISLLELLIGITIGLLVALAAVGSLSYTRVSSTSVGDSSRLQQDAATAFRIIGHHLRQGGARRLQPLGGSTNVEFNPNYGGFGTAAAPIVITGTDGAATDTVQISYDAEPSLTTSDCLGNTPAASANNVTNTFALSGNELRCTGIGNSPAPIIEGAEDLQVWYGVRSGTTLQYQSAPASFASVETVMVCLRLRGELTGTPGAVVSGCNGENIANDGRIRRVFFRVFNLRNIGI
jgi:type IV pilus assembly protein PilW